MDLKVIDSPCTDVVKHLIFKMRIRPVNHLTQSIFDSVAKHQLAQWLVYGDGYTQAHQLPDTNEAQSDTKPVSHFNARDGCLTCP